MPDGNRPHIVVTGGAGYIGSHAVVALDEAGYRVTIVDDLRRSHPRMLDGLARILGHPPTVLTVDITDELALTAALGSCGRYDAVIHCAAYKSVRESVADPLAYYRNNVGGTVSLLAAMQHTGCRRIVFSSSCTVYGQPDVLPVSESSPLRGAASPYGTTKQVCERLLQDAHASAGPGHLSHVVSLRYFNPAGAHATALIGELPSGPPESLVPFITQSAAGWCGPLRVFGSDYSTRDGTAVRDYLHVVDLAEAHVAAVKRALDSDPGVQVFNLGTGTGVTVLEAVTAFESATGVTVRMEMAPRRPGDVEQIWSASDRASTVLGWRTTRSVQDIMGSAWAWQRSLGAAPPAGGR
jgi:UDP-glucose 4-epimerase